MRYRDIKIVCQAARDITRATEANYTQKPLGNGWAVRTVRELLFKKYATDVILYYLIDPKGYQHGGYTNITTFASFVLRFIEAN
jgi:hypothetical protein